MTDHMTPAELRVVREFLGLPADWLADHLGVNRRTIHRWEHGLVPIPDGVRVEVEDLEDRTARFVGGVIDALRDARDVPGVVTYRTDDDYRAAHPGIEWPASWHRACVGRVVQEIPGITIKYA